uniref:glycosyltransferase 87 family protein n=1 Tax=Escherichia coli TaxID=562 RepID=UPI00128FE15C
RFAAMRADLADIVLNDARLLAFGRRAAFVLVPLTLAIVVVLFGTGPDPRHNWYGDFLGNDFTQVWVAGRAALEGRAGEPYDLSRHLANLAEAFGPECRFAWHYPPVFLLPAAAMAWLDPQAGYLVWCALSAALFLLAMRLAAGRTD